MGDLLSKCWKVIKLSAPIAIAGALAMVQAIGEQQQARQIDEMEERIKALESKEDEEES